MSFHDIPDIPKSLIWKMGQAIEAPEGPRDLSICLVLFSVKHLVIGLHNFDLQPL